ncbi:MAG: hypothetical protein HONBIEJF_00938 [Fimbriimonadaceae bacterium]|nr:hypothetical protein [Fimbriimonadaceae bacterium]
MLRTTSLHLAGDPDLSLRVFDTFFEQVATLVERQISLVAEAAFQHHVWEPRLKPLIDVVDMRIVVCELPTSLAVERRRARMLEDRRWSQYHPSSEGWESETYDPPRLPVPLLRVDTTEGYVPDLEAIVAFLS